MDKDWKKILGEQIRARRQNLDMTQTELSEATGIDRANISKIEGGRYNVSVDIIVQCQRRHHRAYCRGAEMRHKIRAGGLTVGSKSAYTI